MAINYAKIFNRRNTPQSQISGEVRRRMVRIVGDII